MYLIESILTHYSFKNISAKTTQERKIEDEKLFHSLIAELQKAITHDIDSFIGQKGYECGNNLLKVQKGACSIDQFRKDCKLCPSGFGHWISFCTKDCMIRKNNDTFVDQYITITFPKQKEFEIALSSLTYAIRLLWDNYHSKLFVDGLQLSFSVGKGESSLDQFRSHTNLCKERCYHWESCCSSLGCEPILNARDWAFLNWDIRF